MKACWSVKCYFYVLTPQKNFFVLVTINKLPGDGAVGSGGLRPVTSSNQNTLLYLLFLEKCPHCTLMYVYPYLKTQNMLLSRV